MADWYGFEGSTPSLRGLFESIAETLSLSPNYEGNLVVERCAAYTEFHSVPWSIVEEKAYKIIGIIPKKKRRIILRANEAFPAPGEKELMILSVDYEIEKVLMKHLDESNRKKYGINYVNECYKK